MILSTSALNGEFNKTSIKTMINMRPYMDRKPTIENGAVLSKISLHPEGITINSTVQDLMNATRKAFNDCLKRGVHFGYLKHYEDKPDLDNIIPGAFMILTNIGQFRLGGPFDDVFIDVNGLGGTKMMVTSSCHFAVIDKEKNRNEATTGFTYCGYEMSKREATMMVKSIHFGLENINLNKTIAEALEMIKDFQNNFRKYEFPKFLH